MNSRGQLESIPSSDSTAPASSARCTPSSYVIWWHTTGSLPTSTSITLSTLAKGSGSNDEVHEHSDQIFYVLQGSVKVFAHGRELAEVKEGDAAFVEAGDVHSVRNDGETPAIYLAVTVPPLEKTH